MTIPDYQSVMLPLLEIVSDDKEHNIREIIERVAEKFQLNEEECRELLPSGRQAALKDLWDISDYKLINDFGQLE